MRGYRVLLVLFRFAAMLALLAQGAPARSEESYSQEKCSLCHIRDSVFFSAGFVPPEMLKSFGEERVCYSCHNGTVRDSRDVLWSGAQHPPVTPGAGSAGKRCSACHSPHAKGGWSVLAGTSVSIRKGGDSLCVRCHGDHARAVGALHRTGFPEGGCSECHRAHGGTGKALLREASGSLCLRCHPRADRSKSGGHPVARGAGAAARRRIPECIACHPVHGKGDAGGVIDPQCAGCHERARGARPSGWKAHPAEAKCTGCHSFHEGSAKNGKALRRDDFRADVLCGACHAGRAAGDRNAGRARGTHPTRSGDAGKDLCLRCHRIHGGAPGTALLVSAKAYACLECHEGQNTISEVAGIVLAHPVFERVEKERLAETARTKGLTLGPAGEIVCRTCHAVHGASPGTPLLARAAADKGSCPLCHAGTGGRDHVPPVGSAAGPDCATCHPVHGKRLAAAPGGAADAWATVCAACHASSASHLPRSLAGMGARPADLPGFDARGRTVRAGAISCPTCHEPHGKPRNKRLRRAYAPSGFVCTACHREKETVALTPHDLRGIAGTSICEPCHRPHDGEARWMWGIAGGGDAGGMAGCRACHREKGLGRPVPPGGHPVDVVATRPLPSTFPLFGASGAKEKKGLLTCATCHEVHGTRTLWAGEGSGLLLRARAGPAAEDVGRVRTCLPCHQGKQAMHGQADCIWCHPPHEKPNAGPECRACHAIAGGGVARIHGEKRRECGTCHRIHGPGEASASGGVCLGCHPGSGRIVGTPHGAMAGGPCQACHPAHDNGAMTPARRHQWEEIFAPDFPCLQCHHEGGEGPAVAHAEHPKSRKKVPTSYGAVVTLETPIAMLGRLKVGDKPLFPLYDETGAKLMSGRMGCPTCHDPHAGNTMKGEEGGGGAGGYLRDPSGVFLAEICAPCHKGAAAERVRKFHDLPRKTD